MGMRAAALILILTLIAPTVAGAVCNLDCVEHQAASTESAQGCHKHDAASQSKLASAGGTICYDEDPTIVAVVVVPVKLASAPAVIHTEPPLASDHSTRAACAIHIRVGPPDLRSTTTQLRI